MAPIYFIDLRYTLANHSLNLHKKRLSKYKASSYMYVFDKVITATIHH